MNGGFIVKQLSVTIQNISITWLKIYAMFRDQIKLYLRPNLKNLSRGLNLKRGSNMVGST